MTDSPDEASARERPPSLAGRTTREVLEDHLRLRAQGELDEDVARNYAEDVVVLHVNGVEHGHTGIRKSGVRLIGQLSHAEFSFDAQYVAGPYAYLEWSATADGCRVRDGADTFVIRDGKIRMQSIHYTLERSEGAGSKGGTS